MVIYSCLACKRAKGSSLFMAHSLRCNRCWRIHNGNHSGIRDMNKPQFSSLSLPLTIIIREQKTSVHPLLSSPFSICSPLSLSVRSKVPVVRVSPFFISCNRRFCSLWCDDWGSQTHLARPHHRTQLIQVQSFPSPNDLQFWNSFLR